METEETTWKDRCERYFSSITESDENVKRKSKSKEKESEWKEISEIGGQQERDSVSKFTSAKKWLKVVDMHGWKLAGTTSNRIESVISIIISILMCGALGFLVYLNVSIYIQQSSHFVTTSHKPIPNESLSFTICNKNLFRKSAASAAHSRFINLANLDSISFSSSQLSRQPFVSSQDLIENSPLWSLLNNELHHQNILKYMSEFDEDFVPYSYMSTANDFDSLYVSSVSDGDKVLRYALKPTKTELKDYGHHRDKILVHCWDGHRRCSDKYVLFCRCI